MYSANSYATSFARTSLKKKLVCSIFLIFHLLVGSESKTGKQREGQINLHSLKYSDCAASQNIPF